MDKIEAEKQILNIETANFVLLSLYREYSLKMLQNSSQKDEYISRLQQIKKDMLYLSSDQLINKTKLLYRPLLREILKRK